MARFHGAIGYRQEDVETAPGVYGPHIVERILKGEVKRSSLQARDGENLNNDISVSTTLEVMADDYAQENMAAIKYAVWKGERWIVDSVDFLRPRLILRLGRRYNGPTPP